MRRRRGKITEVSETLEQVYLEGFGISCQAGICVSREAITLYEHSHGPVSHKRYTVMHEIRFADIADMKMLEVTEYSDLHQKLIDPNNPFQYKNCHLMRIYFRSKNSSKGSMYLCFWCICYQLPISFIDTIVFGM